MNSFYGGISSGFSSIEGYLSKWRHRNILFTPVPDRDISGQPVSAWTFNLNNPAVGLKRNELTKQSKEFMLYNDLYDKDKVNKYVQSAFGDPNFPGWGRDQILNNMSINPKWDFNQRTPSLIYYMIIGNMAGFHADINRGIDYNRDIFYDRQNKSIQNKDQILKKRADYLFLKNLITAWPEMSQPDKEFFNAFVEVVDRKAAPVMGRSGQAVVFESLDNVKISEIDEGMNNYSVKIKINKVIQALPDAPDDIYSIIPDAVKIAYSSVYNQVSHTRFRGYFIPPPGHEFLTMFNYIGFMEKIMNNGLPSKMPADYVVKNLFAEDDLTKIITEIGVIKEIWSRDANGDLVFKHGNKEYKLNDEDQKLFIQKHFDVSNDNCIGTHFQDKIKCNEFIFKCINHEGNDGNLKKCIEYITKTNNFPSDLKKEVKGVHPERALNFLRALGYKIISVGNIDKIQNWNEWMSNTVAQSNLSEDEMLKIKNNENLKRLLTYFVEYINANPAILNKKYDSTKKKVKSLDPCPYPWITKLGVPAISRNMKHEKNVYNSVNNLLQFVFHGIIKPKPVTKQSLFGNNSLSMLNNLSSFLPMLVMGTTQSGGSSKITFPYFNKDVIRQMNGGNPLLNILPIDIAKHDEHNNINLFYKHIDSIVQHQRNRNMNIFSDDEVTEIKGLVRDLENLVKKIQKKMEKLELVNQLINSGFPGIEKLIPLNDKLMEKIVVYVNTIHNGEYNVKNLLNSIVTAMLEEELGSVNLTSRPITSIH